MKVDEPQKLPTARWEIIFTQDVEDEIAAIRKISVADAQTIRKDITEQLTFAPFIRTKRKKPLRDVPPEFARLGVPIWQLTICPYRVQYALDVTGVLKLLLVDAFEKPGGPDTVRRRRKT